MQPASECHTSQSKAPVDRQRSDGDVIELLNQIETAKELTPALGRRVVDLAHLFTLESVGRTLSQGHFPKFDRLLTKLRLISGLDHKKLVGLCFAMTLSRGEAIEALPTFVKDVPKERLSKVRLELQHHLGKVHHNS